MMDLEYAGFSASEAITVLMPLVVFAIGMACYAIFIFRFYRFLARKDIFELDLRKYEKSRLKFVRSFLQVVFYVLKYLILFPFFAFFWFAVLTVFLSFLAKNQTVESILLISISVISAVRVTAYYDEDLSRDLAKMLPFALLGVFLVDLSYFSLPTTVEHLKQTLSQWHIMVYYLAFAMVLELVLRVTTPFIKRRLPNLEND